MRQHLPALPAKDIIRILERHGFVQVRQSGSPAIFRRLDGHGTTVPIHDQRPLGGSLLRQIMRDASLSVDDLLG